MQIDIINCDGCDTLTNCQALYHCDVWVMSLCYVCQPWKLECYSEGCEQEATTYCIVKDNTFACDEHLVADYFRELKVSA